MKKPALQTSTQEECGVWLDTVQLKVKAKKKRLARPISKLLNPLAKGGGYSVAVALNFTQTKMEMPKTKQSSISAFFTSERRVLNKMSTAELPTMDPVHPSCSSILTTPTSVSSGKKRRRDTDFKESDAFNSEPGVDRVWSHGNVTETKLAVSQEHTPDKDQYIESKEERIEEFNPPQSKKRFTDSFLPGDSQPLPQAWSQDPLLASSQYSDFCSEFYLIDHKNMTSKDLNNYQPGFLNSVQNEEAFGFEVDLEGRTSTQKYFKYLNSSQKDDEQEYSETWPSNSPSKHSSFSRVGPLSNHKWTVRKTMSPLKQLTEQLWKRADKEESCDSQFKWTKPRSSPLKKQQSRETAEDSMAMLFTQDSEGFRVISHRRLQSRSPLKDQTNVSNGMGRTSACKSLVDEDEEDEMLFTQDSQGNLVIKH